MLQTNRSKYFNIVDGALALLLFLIFQFVFYLIVGLIPRPAQGTIQYEVLMDVLQIILSGLFAFTAFAVVKIRGRNFKRALTFDHKVSGGLVGLCLATSIVCLFFFISLTNSFVLLLDKCGYTSPLSGLDIQINNFGIFIVSVVVSCLVPALCEEMLMRGVLLNSLRGYGKWVAIIVSAAMFMLVHGNPDQTVHQFILGIILGVVVWETKNLWLSFLIHFFNNFIAVFMAYMMSLVGSAGDVADIAGDAVSIAPTTWSSVVTTFVIGLIFAFIGVLILKAIIKKMKDKQQDADEKIKNSGLLKDTTDNNVEQFLANPIAQGHLASNLPEGHLAEDINTLQADLLADGLDGHLGEEFDDDDYDVAPTHKKHKPLGAIQILTVVLGYGAFIAYFAYEWISILIKGLSL